MTNIESCHVCWDFSDRNPCIICRDTRRDTQTICVVDQPQSLQTIERTKQYTGLYHVLRGTIDVTKDRALDTLKITELITRVNTHSVREVILALSPDLTGENTMMYLERKLHAAARNVTISRLARGLPMGCDLQYADDVTLRSALEHRTAHK